MRVARTLATIAVAAAAAAPTRAFALPNTHAPAISTWDSRASSIVFGLGRVVSGDGDYTRVSYNANFSSTSGLLSAQFGVHYLTFRDGTDGPETRGFSAGGVALFGFPLSERFANGVPRASFSAYVGGVPTALFSGQLNFISIPLVIGAGVPFSPAPWLTLTPWVELSPGLNFDTRIQAVSTASAVQSAMDGTLTREEVEELVDQGLQISRETSAGKRAGLAIEAHLGERVDLGANLVLGAGRGGAAALGAALVIRWDVMVPGVRPERETAVSEACALCRAARVRARSRAARPAPVAAPARAMPAAPRTRAVPAAFPARAVPATPRTAPSRAAARKARRKAAPATPAPPKPKRKAPRDEIPPLQAAPPRAR